MGITVYSLLWVMQDFGHQPMAGAWPTLQEASKGLLLEV